MSKREYYKELEESNGDLIIVRKNLALLIKLSFENVDL